MSNHSADLDADAFEHLIPFLPKPKLDMDNLRICVGYGVGRIGFLSQNASTDAQSDSAYLTLEQRVGEIGKLFFRIGRRIQEKQDRSWEKGDLKQDNERSSQDG